MKPIPHLKVHLKDKASTAMYPPPPHAKSKNPIVFYWRPQQGREGLQTNTDLFFQNEDLFT